jgi:hypothetical protein
MATAGNTGFINSIYDSLYTPSLNSNIVNTQLFNLSTAATQQFTCFNSQWSNYNITLSLLQIETTVRDVKIHIGTSSLATASVWNYNYSNVLCLYDAGTYNATTSFDGITIYTSTGTFTGTIRVYGYRN